MSRQHDPEDLIGMDKWIRKYYGIKDEATDAYLLRNGISADTPQGFVSRMNMALAWLWPKLTPRTRPLYDEIQTIVEDYHQKTSPVRLYKPGQQFKGAEEPTEADAAKCEKAMFLFEQIKQLHRAESALAAQEVFKQAQSARASKPRKLDESACKRIASRYWESKTNGTGYGIAKMLAAEYGVSVTTIHNTVNKYKPLN